MRVIFLQKIVMEGVQNCAKMETFVDKFTESVQLLKNCPESFEFGPWTISKDEVFFLTPLTYGFVNLKPILPGHVLISPRRVVKRFEELSQKEVADLWETAQAVGAAMERLHECCSLTFSIQDGVEAGQTVPHTHIHLIPRRLNDFKKNDDIYTKLDEHNSQRKNVIPDSDERVSRTAFEMKEEAREISDFIYRLTQGK